MASEYLVVSTEQYAGLLYHWLSGVLTKATIRKRAKDFNFKIGNNKDFSKVYEELSILHLWIIVYSCETMLEDEDKRNEILDTFHHLVYDKNTNKDMTFHDWMLSMMPQYSDYDEAMATEHPSTSLWVVADIFHKRLFGELTKDLAIQANAITHIGLSIIYLKRALAQYSIEN